MRPTVPVSLSLADRRTQRFSALVDSGADHVFAPAWIAHTIGVEPDADRAFLVPIAGKPRQVALADVTMSLHAPDDVSDSVEWPCTVAFFTRWGDPPWLVILGQPSVARAPLGLGQPFTPHRGGPLVSAAVVATSLVRR